VKKYTEMQRKEDVVREWFHYDAEGLVLGRLAVEIAKKLMGKEKVSFTPHIDGGDYVIVTNVEKIVATGNKMKDKLYYRHSGFPGGISKRTLGEIIEVKPEDALMLAVKRMLPKNSLGREQLTRLRLFVGAEHGHVAQKPTKVEM
jgi:large subunit ribosomal protein L13